MNSRVVQPDSYIDEGGFVNDPYGSQGQMMNQASPDMMRISAKNDSFLQWFLENKQGIENLKFLWRGWERNNYGQWSETPRSEQNRIMNEQGIHWAGSIMENYLDRVFQATNWNDEHMNYEMRKAYRVVWFGIMRMHKDFVLSKVNCYGVASQVLSRVHAMLLASRGEGIRKFIGTTQTINENRIINPENGGKGVFSGLRSLFSKNPDH